MNKYLLFLIFVATIRSTFAQSLEVNGNIVIENAATEGSRIVIFKNNIKLTEQNVPKKGRFEFKLALDADYRISFEKEGYITKNVNVNTEVPGEIVESNPNFPPIKLIINLLPKVEQVDLSVFDQPVAILSYNQELDDFIFDKEYSDKIRDRIAQTEKNVKQALAQKGSETLKKEQMFAELVSSGLRSFDQKKWNEAIGKWNEALQINPGNRDVIAHIELAQKEADLEKARQSVEKQNEQAYKVLIAAGDSLFSRKLYSEARNSYTEATRLNTKDIYPVQKITEIDKLLTDQARLLAEQQKQQAELDNNYKKLILNGDNLFNAKEFKKSIAVYQEASALKPAEIYPKDQIAKAGKAIEDQSRQIAAEEERKKQEEHRRETLLGDYNRLIAEADAAFRAENYALAKLRYIKADSLNLGEEYPKKQLTEIDNIINSAKYKARLAEYEQNKAAADKALTAKNYASAKFYYQKALTILPIDRENIEKQITEIEKQIEAEQLAALQKAYKEQIDKADKAFTGKAYAVAKFYYQKALEIKINDQYAKQKLQEVEKYISSRQEKGAEL